MVSFVKTMTFDYKGYCKHNKNIYGKTFDNDLFMLMPSYLWVYKFFINWDQLNNHFSFPVSKHLFINHSADLKDVTSGLCKYLVYFLSIYLTFSIVFSCFVYLPHIQAETDANMYGTPLSIFFGVFIPLWNIYAEGKHEYSL